MDQESVDDDNIDTIVKEVDEGEDEMEETSGEEEEDSLQKAKQAITCRSVTLTTLMDDGIIKPGEGVLSIDYLGQRFEADLLENGKIKWPQGSQEEFNTPSAWALHCKRLVNPIKRSGCGWASVKYKNRKLDIWKSMWARKHRINNPFKNKNSSAASFLSAEMDSKSGTIINSLSSDLSISLEGSISSDTEVSTVLNPSMTDNSKGNADSVKKSCEKKLKTEDVILPEKQAEKVSFIEPSIKAPHSVPSHTSPRKQGGSPNHENPLNLSAELPTVGKRDVTSCNRPKSKSAHLDEQYLAKERKSVSYISLGSRNQEIDPHTLVKCEHFDSHSKIQPFTVSLTSNALLLMDFHCHLTKSEVVGYLGGKWDSHKQHLSVEQVFPVRCRLGDKDRASLVEEEIRRGMKQKNQMVVGWYHSHPYCQPDPSIRDVDCQMSYQLKMRGSGSMYLPCIGFIVSPFEKFPPKPDSKIQAFWVMPNLEHPTSFNIPMYVSYAIRRDSSLTEDLLTDMKRLTEFYSGALDKVHLKEHWGEAITYMDKASLRSKLPEDQLESGTFLDYVQQLLKAMR
ncbi:MPN domain-containing protein-like isoform X2 [Physella acuta]|uniref:MPN domain-containing protein-like isoform X2 n=1 Tax=Physella acuta TaxID=109671 RepID=UPI0027DC4234|nr:MPN domain-containing protein-like isoform X2 [Physella acuta]